MFKRTEVIGLIDEADVRELLHRRPGEPTEAPPPDAQYQGRDLWVALQFASLLDGVDV